MPQTDEAYYASLTTDQLHVDLETQADVARCARLLGASDGAARAQRQVDLILDELARRRD